MPAMKNTDKKQTIKQKTATKRKEVQTNGQKVQTSVKKSSVVVKGAASVEGSPAILPVAPTPKPKRRQNQPKTHAGKTRLQVEARRKKIVAAIIEGKTRQEAGIEAGLSPKYADRQVSQILAEPRVRATFAQLLAEVVPDDFHAKTYREAMEATKVISANVIAINGEGMADANSQTKDFIDVPDYAVRLKAADSVAKLKGYIQDRTVHGFDTTATEMMLSVLPEVYAEALRRKFLEMAQKGRYRG